MNIELKFDYYSRFLYVPEGFVYDINELQNSFFDWMEHRPECIVKTPDKHLGFSYDEEDFLRYVNSEILKNSKEKAYFIPKPQKNGGRRLVINF